MTPTCKVCGRRGYKHEVDKLLGKAECKGIKWNVDRLIGDTLDVVSGVAKQRVLYWDHVCMRCGTESTFSMTGQQEMYFLAALDVGQPEEVIPAKCNGCGWAIERRLGRSDFGIVVGFPMFENVEPDIKDYYLPTVGELREGE